MKKIILSVVCLFIISQFGFAQKSKTDTLFVASWNLENLFDAVKDTGKNDGEFLPTSKINWTQERLDKKLENLSKVIRDMNWGHGPDILGVVEVEHQALLDSLVSRYFKDKNYKIAYFESPDKRGIDNGLIYNSDKFKLLNEIGDTVKLSDNYPTRLILNANLLFNKKDTISFFVNHWPARLGGQEKSEPNRIDAAGILKREVDKRLVANPNAKIIIMGDFNDEPGNKSIKEILSADSIVCNVKTHKPDFNKKSELFNLAYEDFSKGMGSYKYRDTWNMLDQIIVSKNLVAGKQLKYICSSFEIFKPEFMVTRSGKYKGTPFPTYGGRTYLGGYSDHFPVTARFVFKGK